MTKRIQRDTLGEIEIPTDAYWGPQTQRAVENFGGISGYKPQRGFIWATASVKMAAAMVHRELKLLTQEKADAIIQAATEIKSGELDDHFVVDAFQAGAGTSHNMNANEVIANRALEILKKERGDYDVIHPNNDVNMAQSTNDVIPTALRLFILHDSLPLLKVLQHTEDQFRKKAKEFSQVLKSGRTHLQDAVPVSLGQEFGAYTEAVKRGMDNISEAREKLYEIGLGGSATGTGLNVHPEYRERVAKKLADITGFKEIKTTNNYFWAMQSLGPVLDFSTALSNLAVEISRIMNDLRLLASGPTTGLNEIVLPAVQPGSSIMPGKVNPVMAEMLNMACFSVIGHHHSVAWAAAAGQLELNVMMPLMVYSIGEQMKVFKGALAAFHDKALKGIKANPASCTRFFENSYGLVTVLNTVIGYEKAAEIVKEAQSAGCSIKDAILSKGVLTEEEIEQILDPKLLTEPGIPDITRPEDKS
ncbi:aspartate ammonia-lyase [candidate division LCP-89 bacterium B3_LCP]|uniref:Aspartate ammonia-lyase n=1 Tax=candidate division LCP-89 bacterium B3_LCP TaxID=2012998 RepID=A0A532V5A9_UNCL8|nr:MAG: aspartate ammonia-lyase [candidate division LCP-89 bacterium B3_LCP]